MIWTAQMPHNQYFLIIKNETATKKIIQMKHPAQQAGLMLLKAKLY